jgi:AraC family transcriptional regulator, regulatory protein of adaptative response / DNA-3-methyladenine glycosylase II
MRLDADACYRAVKTRDTRFDGRFFTGVITTGIYCRPVCPATTPLRKNCVFFACAAAAQEAGFRPCLRCRPETSPGLPAWNGTSATMTRALRLISDGALDNDSVEDLAARLGIGERHLRRLFDEHLGASPISIASTRRFLLAKKLLTETSVPVTDICYAAGFSSVRRFNDVMRAAYGRAPRELRGKSSATGNAIQLTLPFRPPYNWKALMRFLAPRAIPGVEQVSDECYRRKLPDGFVEVRPVPKTNYLVVQLETANIRELGSLVERLRRLFDTDAPIADIEAYLASDPRLAQTVATNSGLRVPGAWDAFELSVRAILGQQVTVKGATTLAGRIVEKFGGFPTPQAMAEDDLSGIGLPAARTRSLRAVAEAFATRNIRFAEDLQGLPGIGEWTAQYIAMRAFNEPDAFPSTDLGLIRAAGREVQQQAEAWRPWRAYAAMHLWMEH